MASISFYGGVGTVTGSKYLLHHNDKKVLVDCGLFQGLKELRERNWQPFPFDPASLDAILITHAHIDHTGLLPRVVKLGFSGPIITTKPTADLLRILLMDSARLQEEEADYRNRHDLTRHSPALPLYDEADARAALDLMQPVHNDAQDVAVCEDVKASFRFAGHIMGSSLVLVDLANARPDGSSIKFLFSGDLGNYDVPILKDPAPPPPCDYLMCESTYGDRLHEDTDPKEKLARVINDAIHKKGPILIPAFAIGRTQEILYLLRELEDEGKIPILPVIVDSPMAAQATQVYNRFREEHDEEYSAILASKRHPLRTGSMQTASNRDESKKVNQMHGVRIIVSASGMISGGRVLHHAMRVLPDPRGTVIFVGFQAAGTIGRRVQDGEKEVRIMKNLVPVNSAVETIDGFSAHADWKGVLEWLSKLPADEPKTVFTTHGEPDAALAMAKHIRERFGWSAVVPEFGSTVELE